MLVFEATLCLFVVMVHCQALHVGHPVTLIFKNNVSFIVILLFWCYLNVYYVFDGNLHITTITKLLYVAANSSDHGKLTKNINMVHKLLFFFVMFDAICIISMDLQLSRSIYVSMGSGPELHFPKKKIIVYAIPMYSELIASRSAMRRIA